MKDLKLTKKLFLVSFLIAVLCCTTVASTAWSAALSSPKTYGSPVTKLNVGESKIIELEQRVKEVKVADPTVVEVMALKPRTLYIKGKAAGTTRLIMKSGDNLISSIIAVEVSPNVALLKTKLHEMFPEEKDIRVTAATDNITLSGTVSSAAVLSQVLALAQSYAPVDKESKNNDNKPKVLNFLEVQGVHQVMLEVRVSEMSRSLMQRLGVNFSVNTSHGNHTFGFAFLKEIPQLPLGLLDTVFRTGDMNWTILVDALKENGLTKVLAEPTLITLSGKTANFLAGGEYPIPVPQGGNNNTITIDYKTFGVALNFTPTVLSNKKISMEVKPEVSDLDFNNAVNIYGYVVPALTTRRVSTTIELADGQSFAIAGLLKDDLREVISKVPLLGDIPILGALFRSTSYQKNETELVIIVTPHLVKPLDMAKQTLPTDAFIEPNDFEFFLLGNMEGRGKKQTGSYLAPPSEGGMEGDFGYITP